MKNKRPSDDPSGLGRMAPHFADLPDDPPSRVIVWLLGALALTLVLVLSVGLAAALWWRA